MADTQRDRVSHPDPEPAGDIGHPRGTLVIVIVFGALLALGWAAMYFGEFLARGAPRP